MKQTSAFPLMVAASAAVLIFSGTPLRASEIDDKIEASFRETYVYKTILKDDSVKADAEEGVVTLTGVVAEPSRKILAQETVASLPGVKRVDNQLTTQAEADAANADTWMGRKVKLTLMFHRNVNGIGTEVEVKDGVVTLKGEVASEAQKELTTAYAKDIEGVKEVKNEMTVATAEKPMVRTAGEKMDDASVTAQVKTALWAHRSTSTVNTKVETRDGAVTLTGIARNAAEKSLVTKLVNDIQGVTSVKNKMTVQDVITK